MANEIKNAIDNAFRDFQTQGIPSSGKHNVQKGEVRSAGSIIQEAVEGAAAGVTVETTWAALSANDGTRNGQPGRVTGPDGGTHTDPVVGGAVDNEGEYRWDVAAGAWQRTGDTQNVEAVTEELQTVQNTVDSAWYSVPPVGIGAANTRKALSRRFETIIARDRSGSIAASAGNKGVGFIIGPSADFADGAVVDQVMIPLAVDATATKVRLSLYRRPAGAEGVPGSSADKLSVATTYALADVGLDAGASESVASFDLPSPVLVDLAVDVVCAIEALDAANELVSLGYAYSPLGAISASYSGWFRRESDAAWAAIGGAGFTPAIAARQVIAEAQGSGESGAIARLSRITRTLDPVFESLFARTAQQYVNNLATGRLGLAVGVLAGSDVEVGKIIDTVAMPLGVDVGADNIRLRVYERDASAPFLTYGPPLGSDILVSEDSFPISELGLIPGSATPQPVKMTVGRPPMVRSGKAYLFEVSALDEAGARIAMGWRFGNVASDLTQLQRGWNKPVTGGWSGYPSSGTTHYGLPLTIEQAVIASDVQKLDYAGSDSVAVPSQAIIVGGQTFISGAETLTSSEPSVGTARKDIVSVDPRNGSVVLTEGTERASAAELWSPSLPDGHLQIGKVYREPGVTRLLLTHRRDPRTGVLREKLAEDAAWLEYCRSCLPLTLDALRNGRKIAYFLYGDSWQAVGGADQAGASTDLNTTPNSLQSLGVIRDRPQFFSDATPGGYDPETMELAGLDVLLDWGDGWGAAHVKAGSNWYLVSALERAFTIPAFDASPTPDPASSAYRNWAVGGSRSDNAQMNANVWGGLWPARLDAFKADLQAYHDDGYQVLVDLGFGMNQLGDTIDTYGDLVALYGHIKDAAPTAEVLMTASWRPASWNGWLANSDERFGQTMRATVHAAIATRSAYFDATNFASREALPSLGLDEKEVADLNQANHSGIPVLNVIGRQKSRIFGVQG